MIINGANVTIIGGEMEDNEIIAYINYLREQNPNQIVKELTIKFVGDNVDLDYTLKPIPFERIRRITGYLVGTLDRFNNAKAHEVQDRVKHGCSLVDY